MKRRKFSLKDNWIGITGLVLILGLIFLWPGRDQTPTSEPEEVPSLSDTSSISGLPCQDSGRRPMAVMLANDPEARPLSGLTEADLVFEMPVSIDGITRLMAVFVCGNPKEIGSIRSGRHDFFPLVLGLDAIYVHWGGSVFAQEKLKQGLINHIDAYYTIDGTFYRQEQISAPHNGFSSMEKLIAKAKKLDYCLNNQFGGYLHLEENKIGCRGDSCQKRSLLIDYRQSFEVEYQYDSEKNSYLRWRGGEPEIDKNNNQQIEAKNIIIMEAEWHPLVGEYTEMSVEGNGFCQAYQNGQVTDCLWLKDSANQKSKLFFYDQEGQEIKFVPGQIWIEIVAPEHQVTWKKSDS